MTRRVLLAATCLVLCSGFSSIALSQELPAEEPPSQTGVHVLHEYLGDQCSFVPDLDVGFCCGAHDDAYADGGTERDRRQADRTFFYCILNEGRPLVASIYYFGVRLFGWLFFNYGG